MLDNDYPLVSIVIPTRDNNPETNLYLKLALEGISMQTYPNIETIVICEGKERSEQLNIGISKSLGKYIMRLDDDWLMQPNTITESVNLIESNQFDFVCVNNIFLKSDNLLSEVRRIEREIITSNKSQINLHIAGNFFRKKDLPKTPFNENLYAGEEYELHDRLVSQGLKFKVSESVVLHLNEYKSWSKFLKASIYYGKNMKTYISTNPNKQRMSPLFSLVRTHYMISIKSFNRPKLVLGFIFFKTLQLTGAFIGWILNE